MIGVMGTASFSKMLHSFPLSGTNQRTASMRGDSAVCKNSLAAPDGPRDRTTEARTDIGTHWMALHQIGEPPGLQRNQLVAGLSRLKNANCRLAR